MTQNKIQNIHLNDNNLYAYVIFKFLPVGEFKRKKP